METPSICTATDELGRTWRLEFTTRSLKDLLNAYGKEHGRPSRAVQEAFCRHGHVNTLRMLVYRGVHGERINLAARALRLGPLPLIGSRVAASSRWSKEQAVRVSAALVEDATRQDAVTMAALEREAQDFRARGYAD